jgi:succinate dehydrogenase / fumarate reductase flavoprotein subunit
MVQYHPTTLAENGFLITEGARGEGAHLLNSEGERFMEKMAPNKMELASRDVVSRAEQIEINEGRGVGPGGTGIYLDITVVPRKRTLEALREIVNIGKDFAGVDITREPIIIQPGQHYIMGGVKTDKSTGARRSRASTRPARWPACRSTAATASAPTRCSTR